jgi:uncharacterized membrane protein YqjE
MNEADETQPEREEEDTGPAVALALHVLRMFETRVDAAGIALRTELQSFQVRLQLRLLAFAALFFAIWGGLVLLAIALPPELRVPVLSGVFALFVIVGVVALLVAKRKVASRDVGSMSWFMDGLRLDFEVLSRSLAKPRVAAAPAAEEEKTKEPDDLAA